MIKTILLGLDGSEHAGVAERYAFWLARRLDAVVVGLHVVDIISIEGSFLHDVSGSLGFEPYLDFSSKMREALQERGKVIVDEFAARAAAAGVRCDTRISTGVVGNEIAEQSRTADLVLLGHRGVNERFTTGLLGSTTESVTRKCSTPVFVAPQAFVAPSSALLAYDGSERAGAALQNAAEWCVSLGLKLAVLSIADSEDTARQTIDAARRYLAAYTLEASFLVRTGPAPETIISVLEQGGYDLLFIGAYGQARLLEMVLGSTTEFVLRSAPCPVVLTR
jgi:nucleotide-binding universal stress UspA family protein